MDEEKDAGRNKEGAFDPLVAVVHAPWQRSHKRSHQKSPIVAWQTTLG
jgi:hypothetical protein